MDQGATAARRAHDRAGKAARRPIEDDRVRNAGNRNKRCCVTLRRSSPLEQTQVHQFEGAARSAICSTASCLSQISELFLIPRQEY